MKASSITDCSMVTESFYGKMEVNIEETIKEG